MPEPVLNDRERVPADDSRCRPRTERSTSARGTSPRSLLTSGKSGKRRLSLVVTVSIGAGAGCRHPIQSGSDTFTENGQSWPHRMRLATWLTRSMRKGQSRRDLTPGKRVKPVITPDDPQRVVAVLR